MFTYFARQVFVPLILRLALALIFILHGLDKIRDENSWGANWHKTGQPLPTALQIAVAYGELFGGLALGLGFLTPLAALGIIALMVGAIVEIHWPNFIRGFEYNFAIIVMCVAVIVLGPGPVALDRYMFYNRRT